MLGYTHCFAEDAWFIECLLYKGSFHCLFKVMLYGQFMVYKKGFKRFFIFCWGPLYLKLYSGFMFGAFIVV